MNNPIPVTLNIPGTLAANHTFQFKFPFDVQLVHVSACNTTANAGTIKVGKSTDDDAYVTATNFGVSSSPALISTPSGFAGVDAGGQYPHIPANTILLVTVTDHASHMANVCVILTFTHG